jgi:signal transduction histidine kinase
MVDEARPAPVRFAPGSTGTLTGAPPPPATATALAAADAPRRRALRESRWMGWRILLLAASALLGCVAVVALAQAVAQARYIDASWRISADGAVQLAGSVQPELLGLRDQRLLRVAPAPIGGAGIAVDVLALQPSSRWLIDDADRARHADTQRALARVVANERVNLVFGDGRTVEVPTRLRSLGDVGALFWLLASVALALYMVGMTVLLARPSVRNLIFLAIALAQAINLALVAAETGFGLGTPGWYAALPALLHHALDLVTAAALVHAMCLHPRRVAGAAWIATLVWGSAAALLLLAASGALGKVWWATQGAVAAYGAVCIALLGWSYQLEPHPSAIVLRRFAFVTMVTWIGLTVALVAVRSNHGLGYAVAALGSLVWSVYFASLLMLVPFLSKSQRMMREFGMLAAVCTIATGLNLLCVTVFALGQLASLALSMFVSLAVYAGARQWILDRLLVGRSLTTGRMFEQLYRIARAIEAHPERSAELLTPLLRDVFDPIEVRSIDAERTHAAPSVSPDGSTLLVPVPSLAAGPAAGLSNRIVALRFAGRGRRMFSSEDARLTGRIVDQLRRAVAYDQAVEQGRSEERLRLAQDLHDDIGARLLTLMYKAQSPEMEQYVRHTLQDLKTLTRGLAAQNHRFSHASAEWKLDLSQRLEAAHVALRWSCRFDADIMFSVVQWSGLTRVLRELVSNAIAHAGADTVEIDIHLQNDRFEMDVRDDGLGRNPRAWAHGLGLGGVRKRVKQLNGRVEWRELDPRGIGCRVVIEGFAEPQ